MFYSHWLIALPHSTNYWYSDFYLVPTQPCSLPRVTICVGCMPDWRRRCERVCASFFGRNVWLGESYTSLIVWRKVPFLSLQGSLVPASLTHHNHRFLWFAGRGFAIALKLSFPLPSSAHPSITNLTATILHLLTLLFLSGPRCAEDSRGSAQQRRYLYY